MILLPILLLEHDQLRALGIIQLLSVPKVGDFVSKLLFVKFSLDGVVQY